MKIIKRFIVLQIIFLGSFGCSGLALAGSLVIQDARLWTAPDHTRVVFDLNGPVDYRVFRLKSPERIVVDIRKVTLRAKLDGLVRQDPVLAAIRYGTPRKGMLRLVMDVKESVRPRSFLLKPMHGKPYRLVVDLIRQKRQVRATVTASQVRARKQITIAVDAGHGGEDPGAIGPHHVKEKDVTLAVAKRLAHAINAQPGMRAVLIRKGDYFVPLSRRVQLARKAKADIMISIHADAVKKRTVSGASVYTLSEKGASDHVAAMLAKKENSSDAIGGVRPGEVQDPLVSRILADLIKRDSLNSAELLADEMLKHIRRIGPIKYSVPKHARFVVLGAPEIPSVLVELDYISNPKRERLLRSSKHQQRLATALLQASESFLRRQGRLLPLKRAASKRRVKIKTTRLPTS
ncbi:MAG: N-acetylmuramoyl-L-alanine amidase [Mariprofundaceae bacterium]|nr:N-acetylmuramoyl-L-alanine amidase [Mariprofundaceae bacterium]